MAKKVSLLIIFSLVIVLCFLTVGCENPNNSKYMSEVVGAITFTDGISNGWTVIVCALPITGYGDASNAILSGVAVGVSSGANSVTLIWDNSLKGTFNKNGTYTIFVWDNVNDNTMRYKNSVVFNGGNASLARSSMIPLM